ncbi:hypothetical protein KSC_056730 [Ktedonobacter sp. SOSP1-52]|nr:hypothetical protein KSC_056730 [Ktedonobacter sp. SOSP1-52]
MVCEPGTRFQAIMATQIIGDNEDVASRIVRFDLFEEFNVVLGIARRRTFDHFFAIADAERSIDPHLLVATTVL